MIYLDHNSTTPLDPRVLESMLPWLGGKWGNASSRDHGFGWDARDAVEEARIQIAGFINAKQNEIIFTGGATESLTLALHGLFPRRTSNTRTLPWGILTSRVEHDAVLAACAALEASDIPVGHLPVDGFGRIGLGELDSTLSAVPARVVCLMAANNETGTLFPIRECAALAHEQNALFLTDATQALGKIPLDAERDGFDLAAFSAHKICGPMGVGALYIRGGPETIALEPLIPGGGQERGLRGGTLNVPAIVGFGEACRLAALETAGETRRLRELRDRLERELSIRITGLRVNGDPVNRLANTSNLCFPGIDARSLIRDMNEIAASTRSACSSGTIGPSHVLKAMGLSDEDAYASVRFSLGHSTTSDEIDRTIEIAAASCLRIRAQAPSS
ncbi:MAG: cysteine desulfurase [Fibrobacterota bacterium]|nr:cysteine desulfurase [Fibrobacterota bacterium]